tara:strand:- start:984 stop:1946 length:963 start_codon:yes stop_codon:yes gene_type:complete
MRQWYNGIVRGVVIGVALAGMVACQAGMEDESTVGSGVPRLSGTEVPDIHGVWQAFSEIEYNLEGQAAQPALVLHEGVPNGGPVPNAPVLALGALGGVPASLGAVVGGTIPYKPETLAQRDDNRANAITRDPAVKCLMPGVPRSTYMGYPFQITQSTNKIMVAYGFSNAGRTIHLDEVSAPGIDSWMGHSVGRWEGDTLVVEVNELIGDTWLDRSGNFHSGGMTVTERYTPITPYHIDYEATITDPDVFTEPWTIKLPLYKRMEEHPQVLEYRCVEMVEELIYGHLRKEQLVSHWEGDYGRRGGTLVIDITRRPTSEPDL